MFVKPVPHIPVLYREALEAFEDIEDGIIIDCTLGYGGHSSMLLEAKPGVTLIGIDQDPEAIAFSTERLKPFGDRVVILRGRYSEVIGEVFECYPHDQIRGVLADIGVSSLQLDRRERGFSFESDALDMRMNPDATLSAAMVVNTYDEQRLRSILERYGELSGAGRLAAQIVSKRPFDSAKTLCASLDPYLPRGKKIHPATLLMQAIRIEVNDELGELERLLDAIEAQEGLTCKVAIISFHSLEDRIVKQRFASWAKSCICPSEAYRCTCGNNHARGKTVGKKPITAQEDELKSNPRSRSAKLRVFGVGLS
ncbi:MAG: 16S rRNA (cytosine(1402)-N(4))-methyltransferase RsmH [Campylobacterales bacterium]|nr:16S rRNA (cytosine(1402)-N(4))-methyltransferase RsmH [Campylobacterales bacterium]